jgi:hypothetical protein
MEGIIERLQRPFPIEMGLWKKLKSAGAISGFVFLFLWIFAPFQMNGLGDRLMMICLGYGLTTFFILLLLNVGVQTALPGLFREQRWTLFHEIMWVLIIILTIAIGNLFYSNFIGIAALRLSNFLYLGGYTVAVGVFPIMVSLFYREFTLRRHFEVESELVNHELAAHPPALVKENEIMVIPAENPRDNLEIHASDLLFIQAAENYIEVHTRNHQKTTKHILRNTLGAVTDQLETEGSHFFRCHKSYLVNVNQVQKVSGNAQGYKLHLADTDLMIPVSRRYNDILHDRLAIHP